MLLKFWEWKYNKVSSVLNQWESWHFIHWVTSANPKLIQFIASKSMRFNFRAIVGQDGKNSYPFKICEHLPQTVYLFILFKTFPQSLIFKPTLGGTPSKLTMTGLECIQLINLQLLYRYPTPIIMTSGSLYQIIITSNKL